MNTIKITYILVFYTKEKRSQYRKKKQMIIMQNRQKYGG